MTRSPLPASTNRALGSISGTEVLHAMERAQNQEEAHAAAHLFLRWLEELAVVE